VGSSNNFTVQGVDENWDLVCSFGSSSKRRCGIEVFMMASLLLFDFEKMVVSCMS
jgi:hypothetical protein